MKHSLRGFTLVELMVATAVFAIFMVGMLNLLDTSTKVSQLESSLADTQENVRFAAYHVMRTARMMGGGGMPMATNTVAGDNWVSGSLLSNQAGMVSIPGFDNVTVKPGTDVFTVRGFFEIAPFFAEPGDYQASVVNIREQNKDDQIINNFSNFSLDALEGRGAVFMGRGEYCVGLIGSGNVFNNDAPDRVLVLQHSQGDGSLFESLNKSTSPYPPSFPISRVGVLDSYTFFIDPDNRLMRARVSAAVPRAEPVAVNIGGLQISLGLDTSAVPDGQVDVWKPAPTVTEVMADQVAGMRLTVLGRSPIMVPDWVEPDSTFTVEDGTAQNIQPGYKWRRIEVATALRNFRYPKPEAN